MMIPTESRPGDGEVAGRLVWGFQQLVRIPEEPDRAALAALRQGLGKPPGTVPGMYPYVQRWLPNDTWPVQDDVAYLVASLFGLHHVHADTHENLGKSFQAIRFRESDSPGVGEARHRDEDPGVHRRFRALLQADSDALGEHLRHLISLLRSRDRETPIDYRRLYLDILAWDHPEHRVQRQWAAGFWSGGQASAAGEDADPGDDNANDAADDGDDE